MDTPLATALDRADFVEHHSRVIEAPPEAVWRALETTSWADLRLTRPLFLLRGLRPAPGVGVFDGGPVELLEVRAGEYAAGGRIARPWRPIPEVGPQVADLDALAAFDAPGWLKYGIDFRLHPLDGGRTRLTTTTLCQATDASARRRFGRYWRIIRPFSGLIRHDLLAAVARRVADPDPGGG